MTTDPQTAIDQLDHLHRITLPDLRRQIEYHQDGKARWRKRAKAAEARVAELELAAVPVAAPPVAVDSSEDRCAECGHFRGAHEEAEEPVSVGRCTVCADEDEWHGFEAVEESPVAAPPTTEQTADDTVRCPLCADARPLHTPAEAHEHFGSAHPEQPLTGPGPWPMLGVPPVPAGRAATLREAADAIKALDRRKIGIEADTIKDAWEEGRDEGADLLRRLADEAQQQPDDEALRAKIDEATATLRRIRSTIRTLKDQGATGRAYYQAITDDLAGPRPDRYEAEQAGGPSRETTEPQPAHRCRNCEGIDPDSCLTNLDRPAVKAQQAATKTPDEAPGQWCKCRSCWGWFVEDHPGEDLDELGRDLGWWSGLPEHRAAPAGVGAPETVHACPPDGSSRPGTEQEA